MGCDPRVAETLSQVGLSLVRWPTLLDIQGLGVRRVLAAGASWRGVAAYAEAYSAST